MYPTWAFSLTIIAGLSSGWVVTSLELMPTTATPFAWYSLHKPGQLVADMVHVRAVVAKKDNQKGRCAL